MSEEPRVLIPVRNFGLYFVLSFLLLAAGHFLVIQRNSQAKIDWYSTSPDAKHYISMVDGSEAKPPFSRRVVAPFLASLLPYSSEESLRLVTYSSLFVFYFVSLLSLQRIGFSVFTSTIALVSVFCCTGHLLLYQNPHIVDAICHMWGSIALFSLLQSNALSYGVASIAGVLSHEMALFSVPSFLATGRWKITLLIVSICFGVLFVTYMMASGDLVYEFPGISPTIMVEAYLTWGIAWIPIMTGLLLCCNGWFARIGMYFLFTLAGASVASLIAAGTVRMFTAIMPVAVILIAFYLDEILRNHKVILVIVLLFFGVNIFFSMPTNLTSSWAIGMTELEDFYFKLKVPIVAFQFVGILINLFVLYTIRDSVRENFFGKLSYLKNFNFSRDIGVE